ncbi:MAG: Ig-like domain-containing protein [bacterium]|nr:Ig-like domain-containing protein [bacterium]
MNKIKTCEGFTLVEIMVAMLILAIGMITLISLLNYGFLGTKKAENKMGVLNFARQKLEEIEDMNFYYIGAGNPGYKDLNLNKIKDPTESDLTGTTHIGNVDVSWAVEVQSIDDSTDGLGAYDTFGDTTDYKKMIISLNWSDQRGAAQSQVLQTFVGPRLLAGSDNIGPSFICTVTPSIAGVGTVTINVSASEKLGGVPILSFIPAYGTAYQGSAITVILVEAADYNESINNFTYQNASPVTISQGNSTDPTDGPTPDGTALINVSGVDDTGNPGSGTGSFVIDTTPPQVIPPPVVVTSTPVEAGNAAMIQVVMADSLSVVGPLLWYQSGTSSYSSTSLTMVSGSVMNGTWSGTVPASYVLDRDPLSLTNDIEYYFEARDGAGNSGTSPHYYFGVKDTVPPVITTVPVLSAIESTSVTLTAAITDFMGVNSSTVGPYIGYQDVDSTYSTTAKMTLVSGNNNNGNWQAVIPSDVVRDWSGDNGYDVIYYFAAWDSANNLVTSPANALSGNFYQITVVGSDTTPPTLSNLKPVNGSTGMPLDTTVSGVFSEPMIESTVVSSGNISLLKGGITVVPATITYNPANYTFTLTPTSSLSYQTTYTAVVTTGVKDLAGNSMAAQQSWTFTTIGSPTTQFYFHMETSPVNSSYKSLTTSGPDKASVQEITQVVGAGGDFIFGNWVSDTTFVNPSGNWTFTVWATSNHNQIQGSFYVRLYYYSSGILFRDTSVDNENIKDFWGTYHAYTWTENISSSAINDRLIARIVFKATTGKSGKNVTVGYDNSSQNSGVFITFSP